MPAPSLAELRAAQAIVHRHMPPTPQIAWPLLKARLGVEVVVKHENHTPTGAFKIRGGYVYMERFAREERARADGKNAPRGIVSATRGNHGQSLALAGRTFGVPVTIVVPKGNSREKNAAMRAFGAELIEAGEDFDAARAVALRTADERGLAMVPSFHADLVAGVASYALELFDAFPDLGTVYVPIGLGSGICGVIAARDALGLKTEVVAVVSQAADAAARSIEAGHIIEGESARTFADGMATRVPSPEAFAIYGKAVARVVRVSDDEVAEAIRIYHEDTHNMAEGAGAAPLAALIKDRKRPHDKACGVILCGGNIDRDWAATVLAGGTPELR
ncbi:MAG: threonine dehydratase [Beijerinckiaceae bacterium]|jgi:threonine dehydratase|nr:threonine dehydratase [Beijerinckiaceae bacterium]